MHSGLYCAMHVDFKVLNFVSQEDSVFYSAIIAMVFTVSNFVELIVKFHENYYGHTT